MQFATFFVLQLFPTYQLFHIQSQPNLAAGFPARAFRSVQRSLQDPCVSKHLVKSPKAMNLVRLTH